MICGDGNRDAVGSSRRPLLPRERVGADGVPRFHDRSAELLGIGSANVRALPIDGERRLAPEAVAEAIAADRVDDVYERLLADRRG